MKPLLSYPAFSSLTEHNLFMKAHAEHGTLVWTDEIDLSPDTLYLRGCLLSGPQAEASLRETAGVSGKRSLDEINALVLDQCNQNWGREDQ